MLSRLLQFGSILLLVCSLTTSPLSLALAGDDGIVKVKSAYPMDCLLYTSDAADE